jgi:hypothetical protein
MDEETTKSLTRTTLWFSGFRFKPGMAVNLFVPSPKGHGREILMLLYPE